VVNAGRFCKNNDEKSLGYRKNFRLLRVVSSPWVSRSTAVNAIMPGGRMARQPTRYGSLNRRLEYRPVKPTGNGSWSVTGSARITAKNK
jgi:hypothetical protein